MGTKEAPTLISSVRRALRLLEETAAHDNGVTAKRLARKTGLPLGTTYHLLRTLVHEGYLRKLDDGGFVLGDALDVLRTQGQTQTELGRIRPLLTALRDELGMATYLARYEDGEIRVVDIVDGPATPRVHGHAALPEAAHASALGKCILRQLDEEGRRDHLARYPPYDITPHTITHPRELRRRLSRSARAGYEWEEHEYHLGTGCAAVPVCYRGEPGALAVSYSADSRGNIQRVADRLATAAQTVTDRISLTM